MAASFSKIGLLGLILIFLTVTTGTSTWARELDDKGSVTETVSIATTSAKGGTNEVLRLVTAIYNPKANPLIDCGTINSPCTTGFGYYDTCCTNQGYYCAAITTGVGICRHR